MCGHTWFCLSKQREEEKWRGHCSQSQAATVLASHNFMLMSNSNQLHVVKSYTHLFINVYFLSIELEQDSRF